MSELSKNYSKTVKSISGSWVISLSFLSLVFIYIVSYYIETGFFGGDGAFSILIGVLGWIICSIFICAFSYFSNKKKNNSEYSRKVWRMASSTLSGISCWLYAIAITIQIRAAASSTGTNNTT